MAPEPEREPDVVYLTGERLQGTHLLGSVPDLLASAGMHVRLDVAASHPPGATVTVLPAGDRGVNGSQLALHQGAAVYSGTDSHLVGVVLNRIGGGQVRISAVPPAPITSVSPSARYTLQYTNSGAPSVWLDYCAGGGDAIALYGDYDVGRTHLATRTTVSFACEDGAAAKCDAWGYVAGDSGPSNVEWQYHQACTGMTNARYCGDDRSFTREQTPIVIRDFRAGYAHDEPFDLAHPSPLPGDPDTHYLEAWWDEHGKPICLSKLRWAGLPPNPCPGVLDDPRFSDRAGAVFCDDLASPPGLLANGSKMMDAPLHRWRNAAGDDVTTIRGLFVDRDGDGLADAGSTFPFPGYTTHVGTDGMLLRNVPGSLAGAPLQPLYALDDAGDRSLTTTGAGRADPSFEGYSFNSSSSLPGLAAFQACKLGGDRDSFRGALPPGCVFVQSLAYALAAP